MTHLEAMLRDFQLVKDDKGQELAYRFRFGRCEDFADTLDQFKAAIDMHERRPTPENAWLWEVDATPANRTSLGHIFDNFEECYEIARSQLRLFQ